MNGQHNNFTPQNGAFGLYGLNSATGNRTMDIDNHDGAPAISLCEQQQLVRAAHSNNLPARQIEDAPRAFASHHAPYGNLGFQGYNNDNIYAGGFTEYSITNNDISTERYRTDIIPNVQVDLDPKTSYLNRLRTYINWPPEVAVSPHYLARAGLKYMDEDDRTQCEFCRGILYSWDDDDDPLVEHSKHFENCEFIKGRSWEVLDRLLEEENRSSFFQSQCVPASNGTNVSNQLSTAIDRLDLSNQSNIKPSSSSKLNTAIDIVKSMGYDDKIIQKAIENIIKRKSNIQRDSINSSLLLDNIFELEESESQSDSDDEEISSNSHLKDNQEAQLASATLLSSSSHLTSTLNSTRVNDQTFCKAANQTPCHDNSNESTVKRLAVERAKLKQNVTCNLCFNKDIGLLFLPCRHMIACEDCGSVIKECLICSKKVVSRVRIYMT